MAGPLTSRPILNYITNSKSVKKERFVGADFVVGAVASARLAACIKSCCPDSVRRAGTGGSAVVCQGSNPSPRFRMLRFPSWLPPGIVFGRDSDKLRRVGISLHLARRQVRSHRLVSGAGRRLVVGGAVGERILLLLRRVWAVALLMNSLAIPSMTWLMSRWTRLAGRRTTGAAKGRAGTSMAMG